MRRIEGAKSARFVFMSSSGGGGFRLWVAGCKSVFKSRVRQTSTISNRKRLLRKVTDSSRRTAPPLLTSTINNNRHRLRKVMVLPLHLHHLQSPPLNHTTTTTDNLIHSSIAPSTVTVTSMSVPASHQSPVVLQRQHSTRQQQQQQQPQQHQRQMSTSSRHASSASRDGDRTAYYQPPPRDQDQSRMVPSAAAPVAPQPGQPSANYRPSHSHSRTPSVAAGSNGTSSASHAPRSSSHQPPPPQDDARLLMHQQQMQQQRPRKTSIHGSSGAWNLGKTIGAGSMGKVKLARKVDGSEQVRSLRLCFPSFAHSCRSPSRLCRDRSSKTQESIPILVNLTSLATTTARRYAPPGRRPSSPSSTTPTSAACAT